MRVDFVSFPGLRLAGVQHDGPFEQIGNAFEALGPKAGDLGPPRTPDAQWVAVYVAHSGAGGDQSRSYATVSVADDAEIGDLEEVRVPPGTYARTVHVGPYGGLAGAWKVFGSRLTDSGHHVLKDRPAFEIYVNQEEGTPEGELRTELYFPVR